MKKTTLFLSRLLAVTISASSVFSMTALANTVPGQPSVIANDNSDMSPYFKYLQSIALSVDPSSSETSYLIYIVGTDELKSVSGTATLYKKNNSGSSEKKASQKHSLSGSFIVEESAFDSYGPGDYKITFTGIAYSTSGGKESISISATNSY